eukprot:PhF_6_TR4891/c0_g1_i1/m.6912
MDTVSPSPIGTNSLAELEVVEAQIKKCLQDLSILNADECITRLAQSKRNEEKHGRPVAPETAEKITKLVTKLQSARKKNITLRTEQELLEKQLSSIEEGTQRADERHNALMSTTQNGTLSDMFGSENEAHTLKSTITSLVAEQNVLKQELSRKQQELSKLVNDLEICKQLEEEYLQTSTSLQVAKSQLIEVQDEESILNHITKRKALVEDDANKDEVMENVKLLEGDKTYLHTKLKNHSKQMESNNRTILTNGFTIAQLTTQLQCLAGVLRTENIALDKQRPGAPQEADGLVEASILEESASRYVSTRRALQDCEAKLQNRDTQVEVLECRVQILSRANQTAVRLAQLERKDQELEYAHMQNVMQQRQAMYVAASARLKSVQQQLKKKLKKTSESVSPPPPVQ